MVPRVTMDDTMGDTHGVETGPYGSLDEAFAKIEKCSNRPHFLRAWQFHC